MTLPPTTVQRLDIGVAPLRGAWRVVVLKADKSVFLMGVAGYGSEQEALRATQPTSFALQHQIKRFEIWAKTGRLPALGMV